jgi:hypothetical protein
MVPMSRVGPYREYQTYWHERNFGCRVRQFVYRGHRCVSLENELLRIVVATDKGADITEFLYKALDVELLWQSWNGLRRFEHFRPSTPLGAGHFREHYPGGWHEMLPNGPVPTEYRGAAFGYHGEVTLLPWDCAVVMDEPERVEVRFLVRTVRVPLVLEKVLILESGSATLRIRERLRSEAGQDVDVLWGHHPTFGWPFVERGCRVHLPACMVRVGDDPLPNSRVAPSQVRPWPFVQARDGGTLDLSEIPGPEAASQDFVRLEDLADGWFAVVNPRRELGFALSWDRELLPNLGFWQVLRGGSDYPWYGMNYLVALEPARDLASLADAASRGSAIRLGPASTVEMELEATVFRAPLEVRAVRANGIIE